MRRSLWVLAMVLGVATSCGESGASQADVDALNDRIAELENQLEAATSTMAEPPSKTITGTFTVQDGSIFATTGERCSTEGGYDDIGAGTQVVVRDGSDGATLATGALGAGRWAVTVLGASEPLRYCEFSLSVEGVPTGHEFYEIEVGRRGSLTFTAEQLEAGTWEVALSVG